MGGVYLVGKTYTFQQLKKDKCHNLPQPSQSNTSTAFVHTTRTITLMAKVIS